MNQPKLIKMPVKHQDGSIELIELESIFYLEAREGDTWIRTARKKMYRSVQELHELASRLPAPHFVRCHRGFIVNLKRVRAIVPRGFNDHDFKLDPPVNTRIPIARSRFPEIRSLLGL